MLQHVQELEFSVYIPDSAASVSQYIGCVVEFGIDTDCSKRFMYKISRFMPADKLAAIPAPVVSANIKLGPIFVMFWADFSTLWL